MDLLFLDDLIALHIMDVFSKYSILTRVRSKNPQEVWGAFVSSWIGVFGPPKSLHLDEGGEWKNSKLNYKKDKIVVTFDEKFLPRRGRINCSMQDKGNWRWFGTQFTLN